MGTRKPESRFRRLSAAGIFFQGGAAAVDSSTIIATLVHGLTANTYAVGAASAILRYGWLFPQIFVAYLAQRRQRRMPFYMVGAFGRAACLVAIAGILGLAGWLPHGVVVALFFVLWTTYAFVSGIVAVPYNDIVARSVVSERRSRLLAIRFFGGAWGGGGGRPVPQFVGVPERLRGYRAAGSGPTPGFKPIFRIRR